METILTPLLNDIAHDPTPIALILDDYHLIDANPVHATVAHVLDHLPSQLHLLMATRSDPPLPLSRLRGRGELHELRTAELRFTSDETAVLLNEAMGLTLSGDQAAVLAARTEGWAVGLQMAALSLRGRDDVPGFVQSFSGSHRFVLDYLLEEVLDRQPPEIQEFLLKTSALERLTASLCDALTGRGDGQAMLVQLEQDNLFLVPLDDERRWYRYHQLFADLLRSRLAESEPDQIPLLRRRAGQWYEGRGQIVEAVGLALQAGDVDWLERLLAENALAVIYHGELATVVRWLEQLPDDVVRARPRLGVARAWVLAHMGQLDDIEPLLQAAGRALDCPEGGGAAFALGVPQRQHIAGHIAAIRAYVAALSGETAAAVELARGALARLPATDLTVRGWTTLLMGCMLRSQGDFGAAEQAFAEARAISRESHDAHLEVDVLGELAVLQSGQGQLRGVASSCEQAIQIAEDYARQTGKRLPVTAYTYTMMGRVLYEWNDLERALGYAREGIELCQRWGQVDALAQGYLYLAPVLRGVGDTVGALNATQEVRRLGENLHPWYALIAGAHEARMRLAQGDVEAAARWIAASGLRPDGELIFEYSAAYLALARVLSALGRPDEALKLLSRLLQVVEAKGAIGPCIAVHILQALILQALNQEDQALAALERALVLAEPEGYVRGFIGEGEPMAALLRQAALRGIAVTYVGQLLSEWAKETKPSIVGGGLGQPGGWVESLTGRELEVLRLLAVGLTNREIADQLYLALGTVKKHTSHIYGKLGVNSRTRAAARARELGLL